MSNVIPFVHRRPKKTAETPEMSKETFYRFLDNISKEGQIATILEITCINQKTSAVYYIHPYFFDCMTQKRYLREHEIKMLYTMFSNLLPPLKKNLIQRLSEISDIFDLKM